MATDTVLSHPGTSASIAVEGAVGGEIDFAGDQDWYTVELIAGHQYRFNLRGTAKGAGTLEDPFLRLLDANGFELVANDDSAGILDSRIVFVPTVSGTYLLAAQALGPITGTYVLFATDLSDGAAGEVPGNATTTATLTGSVAGSLDPAGDQDWYKVSLIQGHQYRVELRGADSDQGTLANPLLRVLDGASIEVAFDDDGAGSHDASLIFTATSTVHYLVAQSTDGGTGTFVLSLTDITAQSSDGQLLEGTAGDELLKGTTYNDQVFGYDGQDQLEGKDGNDTLSGGPANDTLAGGQGDDVLLGGQGADYFSDYHGSNQLTGASGPDTFVVELGQNRAAGGEGQDRYVISPTSVDRNFVVTDFSAGAAGDLLDVTALLAFSTQIGAYSGGDPFASGVLQLVQSDGDVQLKWDADGAAGILGEPATQVTLQTVTASSLTSENFVGQFVLGSDQSEHLFSGPGNDTIVGLQGNDTLDGSTGKDSLVGGAGNDLYLVDDEADLVVETSNNPAPAAALGADGIDGVTDAVVATVNYALAAFVENGALAGSAASLNGNELSNQLVGNGVANSVNGLEGDDSILGGDADDFLQGNQGADTLRGGFGDDLVRGGQNEDLLYGGVGFDTLYGDLGDDVIHALEQDDFAYGGGGSDSIAGGIGNDVLVGDDGTGLDSATSDADTVSGQDGNDTLFGDQGDDLLRGNAGTDSVLGANGNDTLEGNEGSDTLRGSYGDDVVRGGQDADVLYGGQQNDLLLGALGDDEMRGAQGSDTLSGGQGSDTLYGGVESDLLQGRLGNDLLTGGVGADLFWFNSAGAADADTILDFEAGIDKIQLDAVAFATTSFGVNVIYDAGTGELFYDADGAGGGTALLIATLTGAPLLTGADISVL